MLLRDTLQAKGYRTIEATTGGEGVRMAGELHPDLILMNIRLPGISGIEALGQLRADPGRRTVLVIAVTASIIVDDRTRVMVAEFDIQKTVGRLGSGRALAIGGQRAPGVLGRRAGQRAQRDAAERLAHGVVATLQRDRHRRRHSRRLDTAR